MKRIWFYLSNVFDRVTRLNFKKGLSLGTDHGSKLQSASADPDIQMLYDRFKPLQGEYVTAYNAWISEKNKREGETLRFTSKMAELNDQKIKQWDIAVQSKYMEGTPEYKAIFTNGRSVFRQGTYETRIAQLGALRDTLADYPSLATLQAEIGTFYDEILAIRNVQQGTEQTVSQASDNLEQARIELTKMMYSNLGFLMYKYYENPSEVEGFFDLSLLRSSATVNGNIPPEPLTGTVEKESTATIMEGGFDSNTLFHIINTGGTSLKFYTAKLPSDPVPGSAIELVPGEETDVYASELGAETNLFLMAFNPDLVNAGEYSVMIVEDEEEE
jgi:hypothetical protein